MTIFACRHLPSRLLLAISISILTQKSLIAQPISPASGSSTRAAQPAIQAALADYVIRDTYDGFVQLNLSLSANTKGLQERHTVLIEQMIIFLSDVEKKRDPSNLALVAKFQSFLNLEQAHDAIDSITFFLASDDLSVRRAAETILRISGILDFDVSPNGVPYYKYLSSYFDTASLAGNGSQLLPIIFRHRPNVAFNTLFTARRKSDLTNSEAKALVTASRQLNQVLADTGIRKIDPDVLKSSHTALNELLASRHSWIRLYAASILAKVKDLRDDDLLQRLKADADPIVRDFASQEIAP